MRSVESSGVISKLQMEEFYPKKLKLEKVITVTNTDQDSNRGLTVVRGLMMLNHNAPIITLLDCPKDRDNIQKGVENLGPLKRKFLNLSKKVKTNSTGCIHPQDVINVIYNCCDEILLQHLTGKLYTCRLSIPLIFPDMRSERTTCLLWSLRGIVPEFKNVCGELNHKSLVDLALPMISFMRIGKLKRSKSQLLNQILSPLNHETFFHRDGKLGTSLRMISNGTVEVSWFLPSDNESTKFRKMFSMLNLRGDSTEHTLETSLIFRISSLNFLMMNTTSVKEKAYQQLKLLKSDDAYNFVLCIVCNSVEDEEVSMDEMEECTEYFQRNGVEVTDVIFDWQGSDLFNFEQWKNEIENTIQNLLLNYTPRLKFTRCCGYRQTLSV